MIVCLDAGLVGTRRKPDWTWACAMILRRTIIPRTFESHSQTVKDVRHSNSVGAEDKDERRTGE